MDMLTKERADQVAGGVFLVGLGLLFTNIISFWPGILFVIGASAIARGMAEGRAWYNVSGGVWMLGLGVLFLFNFSWPLILVLIGLSMLFGRDLFKDWGEKDEEPRRTRHHLEHDDTVTVEKPKNDEYAYRSNDR